MKIDGIYIVKCQECGEIPFDSNRKLMTTIHKTENGYRVITKGAIDILVDKCNKYIDYEKEAEITENIKEKIKEQNLNMADKALRVIGVAYKDVSELPLKIDTTFENNLVFSGFIGMIDPPREGVKEAIQISKNAGIKVVMITGDHIATAKAIAKEIGILDKNGIAITGAELDKLSQSYLEKNIMNYSVFARVSPEHKTRIVKAFQSRGLVVAMTGDGINDAPALHNADIGVAMGMNGTDVAKNASDMILTDDNFVTIVSAIKQGRTILANIIKAIHFLLSTNIGEIVIIFLGLIMGFESPLLAIQLLWINLVTDSLPAIALSLEPPEENIMYKKPREKNKSVFADNLWEKIIFEGFLIGILALLSFSLGNKLDGLKVGRTMAFVSLGIVELFHSFNIKTEGTIFSKKILDNIYLILAFIVGVVMQVSIVFIPFLADKFDIVKLNFTQWGCVFGICSLIIVIMEMQKAFNDFKFGKVVYTNKRYLETVFKD